MYFSVKDVTVLDSGKRSFRNKNGETIEYGQVTLATINKRGYQEVIRATCGKDRELPASGTKCSVVVDYQERRGASGVPSPKFKFVGWRE